MLVCQESKLTSAVCCPVCGQSFLIYSEQGLHVEQDACRRIIRHALRTHHTTGSTTANAHPVSPFNIPSWSGARPFSVSATLGNLLDNAFIYIVAAARTRPQPASYEKYFRSAQKRRTAPSRQRSYVHEIAHTVNLLCDLRNALDRPLNWHALPQPDVGPPPSDKRRSSNHSKRDNQCDMHFQPSPFLPKFCNIRRG